MNATPAAAHADVLREFIADSLALWRVAGSVEAGEAPAVAVIRAAGGTIVRIERPAAVDMPAVDIPFRWLVRSAAGGADRTRPCASLVGLLNALRSALDVDRGGAVRIAPAPTAR